MKERNYIDQNDFENLYTDLLEVRKKLNGLIKYLRNSPREGYKFNDPSEEYGDGHS
jgi:DNA-binding winged helix-turn-helix (wHTH) protein